MITIAAIWTPLRCKAVQGDLSDRLRELLCALYSASPRLTLFCPYPESQRFRCVACSGERRPLGPVVCGGRVPAINTAIGVSVGQ